MDLKKLGGQIRRRMLMEATRDIRNSNFIVSPNFTVPKARHPHRNFVTNESPGACQLQGSIAAVAEKIKCIEQSPAGNPRRYLARKPGGTVPVAGCEGTTRKSFESGVVIGVIRKGCLK